LPWHEQIWKATMKNLTAQQQATSDRVHLLGNLQARLLNEVGRDAPVYQQIERDLDAAIDERSRSMGWATFAPSPPPAAPALATMPPSSPPGQGGTSVSAALSTIRQSRPDLAASIDLMIGFGCSVDQIIAVVSATGRPGETGAAPTYHAPSTLAVAPAYSADQIARAWAEAIDLVNRSCVGPDGLVFVASQASCSPPT
jgi:hypothetical protein